MIANPFAGAGFATLFRTHEKKPRSSGAMPAVGSSMRSRRGRLASATASSTRLRSP